MSTKDTRTRRGSRKATRARLRLKEVVKGRPGSLVKRTAFGILRNSLGSDTTDFIREITFENVKGEDGGTPAMIHSPILLVQPSIKTFAAKAQAFILVHEWLHMKMEHHQILINLRNGGLAGIPSRDRLGFIGFACDLWVNQKVENLLGYKLDRAVKVPWKRFRDLQEPGCKGVSHQQWVKRVAMALWRNKGWRKEVRSLVRKAFPGRIVHGRKESRHA